MKDRTRADLECHVRHDPRLPERGEPEDRFRAKMLQPLSGPGSVLTSPIAMKTRSALRAVTRAPHGGNGASRRQPATARALKTSPPRRSPCPSASAVSAVAVRLAAAQDLWNGSLELSLRRFFEDPRRHRTASDHPADSGPFPDGTQENRKEDCSQPEFLRRKGAVGRLCQGAAIRSLTAHPYLRACAKITWHFGISCSHHLRPLLNREILNVDRATPAVSLNRSRPNLVQI